MHRGPRRLSPPIQRMVGRAPSRRGWSGPDFIVPGVDAERRGAANNAIAAAERDPTISKTKVRLIRMPRRPLAGSQSGLSRAYWCPAGHCATSAPGGDGCVESRALVRRIQIRLSRARAMRTKCGSQTAAVSRPRRRIRRHPPTSRACFQRLTTHSKNRVGMAGFEPATSCSQSRRANQAALHPDRAGATRSGRRRRDSAQVYGSTDSQRQPLWSWPWRRGGRPGLLVGWNGRKWEHRRYGTGEQEASWQVGSASGREEAGAGRPDHGGLSGLRQACAVPLQARLQPDAGACRGRTGGPDGRSAEIRGAAAPGTSPSL